MATPGEPPANATQRVLPEGIVTFLFTDIEGSTKLLRQLDERYVEALAAQRRLFRAAVVAHGGVEVDTQGDAFFVAFADAAGAVAGAAAAQRALAAYDWPGGLAVNVRMGLHTGAPPRTDEGYTGLNVVRGARICSAAHGGQVLLSQETVAAIGD